MTSQRRQLHVGLDKCKTRLTKLMTSYNVTALQNTPSVGINDQRADTKEEVLKCSSVTEAESCFTGLSLNAASVDDTEARVTIMTPVMSLETNSVYDRRSGNGIRTCS